MKLFTGSILACISCYFLSTQWPKHKNQSNKEYKSPLRTGPCSMRSNSGTETFFVPSNKSGFNFLFSVSQTNFDILETYVFKESLQELS